MRWLASLALACGIVASGSAQTPPGAPLPTVTSFTLAVLPQIFQTAKVSGSTEVLVTTDGRQVIDVRGIRSIPLLPVSVVEDAVRTWRFAPHTAQSFKLTLRAGPSQNPDACRDSNWRVALHLPVEVVLEYPSQCCILESVQSMQDRRTLTHVRGIVRDEADRSPVIDGSATLSSRDFYRSVETDEKGRFDLGPVPPGEYSLQVGGLAYGLRSYDLDIRSNVFGVEPQIFEVIKKPNYRPSPPSVEVNDVVLYPLDLRDAGLSGDVKLHVDADGRATVLDGPKALADAALSNLKTWRWLDKRLPKFGVDVTFHYRLLAGDCTGDNGPFITARYPFDVDIAMKRAVPCGHF